MGAANEHFEAISSKPSFDQHICFVIDSNLFPHRASQVLFITAKQRLDEKIKGLQEIGKELYVESPCNCQGKRSSMSR
jgi:hypothetical protein